MGERIDDAGDALVLARSFVVRALLERPDPDAEGRWLGRRGRGAPRWHGYVTDTETGHRLAWVRPRDVALFIQQQLEGTGSLTNGVIADAGSANGAAAAAEGVAGVTRPEAPPHADPPGVRLRGLAMAAPPLTDVVTEMLTELGQRMPPPVVNMPAPNVTLERVHEKLVGLGRYAGDEPTGTLGTRAVRGGRLDARVRFQLWAATASDVDSAMQDLHTSLLGDVAALGQAGFLQLAAADTTLAEQVAAIPGWRKATSYDVLYEYRYVDTDEAQSLIVRIPLATDPEQPAGPAHEVETLTGEVVRWDQEGAPVLTVRGPNAVTRVSALVHVPGPPLGGTVTFARTSGGSGPVTHLPTLQAFLDATAGPDPTGIDADVQLDPAAALAALGAAGPGLAMGDWDADGVTDAYDGFERRLGEPITLATASDRFAVTYTPPAGPATGLDQTAVVYLRVD